MVLAGSSIALRQAKVLRPLMFIAHEPQMPDEEKRREDDVSAGFLLLPLIFNTEVPQSPDEGNGV